MTAFDTLAAASALENAGIKSEHAKAFAAQLGAAATAGEPVSRPEMDAALASLEARMTNKLYAVAAALAGLMVALKFFP